MKEYNEAMPSGSRMATKPAGRADKPKSKLKAVFFVSLLSLGVLFFVAALSQQLERQVGCITPHEQGGLINNPINQDNPDHIEDLEDGVAPTPERSADEPHREGVYTFIIAGVDDEGYNTDVLMVAALDVTNGTLNVLSIPRDTQVPVSRSIKRINAAWGVGGIDRLREELSWVIGFVPDTYVVIDLKGFIQLVDTIGGVDFDVPQRMHYSDPDQNLYIDLQKGPQRLYGEQAMQLIRFRRYQEGDIKRIEVTQAFLKEVVKQTLSIKNAFKVAEFAQIALENVRADLSLGEMIWIGNQIMHLDSENVTFYTLPGDPYAMYKGQSYFLADPDETIALINEVINPFEAPITKDQINVGSLRDN